MENLQWINGDGTTTSNCMNLSSQEGLEDYVKKTMSTILFEESMTEELYGR